MHKIGPSGGFFGRLLRPVLKTGLPLTKNTPKPLVKKRFNNIRINSSSINNRCIYSKEIFWIRYANLHKSE